MKRPLRILGFAAVLLAGACARPQEGSPQYLVRELLSKIDSADYYIAKVEARLAEKSREIAGLSPESIEYYDACIDLGSRYTKFVADSSIVYYDKAAKTAVEIGEDQLYYKALLHKARVLFQSGYYTVGYFIIDSIPQEKLDSDNYVSYLNAFKGLYHDLYLNLDSKPELRAQYVALYEQYRDSVMALIPPDNRMALRENERICARTADFDQALRYNDRRLASTVQNEAARAAVLYDRYIIYHHYMGRPPKDHIECLLESAIYDVVSANQDIASMRYVERYLASIGSVNAAKKVSDYYYNTMVRLGSRSRLLSNIEASREINEDFSRRLTRQNKEIQYGMWLIILLAIMLIIIIFLMIRSRDKIVQLNKNLERSGKMANSYVLGFFQLYSSYITRLLALRAKINTNTRKGNIKYVLDLTDPSKDITNDELKQMYYNFDRAFLDIFPNFVQDFNSLLRPECRIELKPTELLNMDLRIFAIIKLGITDSSKISELLHCSIKTVYNKRSGINSRLLVPKDEFAEKLSKL